MVAQRHYNYKSPRRLIFFLFIETMQKELPSKKFPLTQKQLLGKKKHMTN